ncbi:MAG: hypothetical protein H7844_06615 [Nitrospirae bacterium YQR-1]
MKEENTLSLREKILSGKVLFAIAVVLCLFLSIFVRYHAMSKWEMQPDMYFYGRTPLMSTVDGYHWIIKASEYAGGAPALSSPLISVIAVKLSAFFNGNHITAAFYTVFILSGLFIIPLSLFFYKAGHPGMAVSASVFGTFGKIYYERTAIGRFDTDLLNLFFPFLASFFILKSSEGKTLREIYLYSVLTGISLFFFDWWYQGHRGFTFIYLTVFTVSLFLKKIRLKHIVVSFFLCFSFSFLNDVMLPLSSVSMSAVFFIMSALAVFAYKYKDHSKWEMSVWLLSTALFLIVLIAAFDVLKPGIDMIKIFIDKFTGISTVETLKTGDSFPTRDIFTRETKHFTPQTVLSAVFYSGPWLPLIGISGFCIFVLLNLPVALMILPVFFIGLLSFKSEIRLAMYLPPFAGAGLGYLLALIVSACGKSAEKIKLIKEPLVYALIFAVFFVTGFMSAYSYNPFLLFNGNIYKGFKEIKRVVPEGSKVFTWWDSGYVLQSIGLKTYHDPGPISYESTYFTARGLSVSSQRELYNVLCYIDRVVSTSKVNENKNAADKILRAINFTEGFNGENVYILFSNDMIHTFNAVTNIGNWDFAAKSNEYKKPIKFLKEVRVEDATGTLNGNIPLKSVVISDRGEIKDIHTFPNNPDGQYLEIIKKGPTVLYTLLMDEKTYRSNFNQMFILGIFDKSLFKEIYNDFPYVRLFKPNTKLHSFD